MQLHCNYLIDLFQEKYRHFHIKLTQQRKAEIKAHFVNKLLRWKEHVTNAFFHSPRERKNMLASVPLTPHLLMQPEEGSSPV